MHSSQPAGRSTHFPDPRLAGREGLVAIGGKLDPDWLLDAYRHGVFPWPQEPDDPMLWWSPDPRCMMPLEGMRVSSRLRRRLRSGAYRVTCDEDFAGVMQGCATAQDRSDQTWITPEMLQAYQRLHRLGHAHSVEAWSVDGDTRRLVGGVYGVAVGGLFAGESMFHHATDASKVALASLVAHLRARGYRLFDIQQWTSHTGSLGAVEIPRAEYLDRLATVVDLPVSFGDALELDAPW